MSKTPDEQRCAEVTAARVTRISTAPGQGALIMVMTVGGSQGPVADPNIVPLIDVLLVLIIIFMVITPKVPTGLSVLVPQPLLRWFIRMAGVATNRGMTKNLEAVLVRYRKHEKSLAINAERTANLFDAISAHLFVEKSPLNA